MYKKIIKINDVLISLSANHKYIDKNTILDAYYYASQKHKGQFRKTGEAYIMHPLRVAKLTADWGFDSDVIIAALLHDVIEDCHTTHEEISEKFGVDIADKVEKLSQVNKELAQKKGLSKEEIDNRSDAKLLRSLDERTLFIKIADRIDNLNTMDAVKPEKQFKKAQHTRELLLPLVKLEKAYQLVDILEELCFKIEHQKHYDEICKTCNKIREENKLTQDAILKKISDYVTLNKSNSHQNDLIDFLYAPRSAISIYRQLSQCATNLKDDFFRLMTKDHLALYDLTLVVANHVEKPMDTFMQFYKEYNLADQFYMVDYRPTTYQDSNYILIQDNMDNLYRLFIKTEQEYMRYRLGNIVDENPIDSFVDSSKIDFIDPRDAYKKKIKIFLRDGSERFIDEYATVLDCAFEIHSKIGLHFDYAMINHSTTHLPAYTRLNEGDIVTIMTSEKNTPDIRWFNYLKTSKATHHLVKYFSNILNKRPDIS